MHVAKNHGPDVTTASPMQLVQLANYLDAKIVGSTAVTLSRVAPLDCAGSSDLAFLANPLYVQQALDSAAGAIIIGQTDFAKLSQNNQSNARSWLIVANPYASFARAAQLFATSAIPVRNPGRSQYADISANAYVPASCHIGSFVSIEAGAVLGERVQLVGHIHIGANVRIADDTLIYSRVSIYHDCVIGARCIVHSGAVIGADGFGFAPDFADKSKQGEGEWVKIPQTGKVIIGDHVEIGANTTIDRGAMADTIIERGCKFDNQVQIAHNVHVGPFTIIAGSAAVAGSTKIGAHCMIGGAANIAGHLTIADRVIISGGTSITKSLPSAGHFTSVFPFMTHRDWEKNAAVLRQLSKLRTRLRQIETIVFTQK